MTFERVDWHVKQLTEARRAGVDVILPLYRGDMRSRQLYTTKGLTLLGAALESLKRQDQDYPQIGLYLDTTALIEHFGDRTDLRDRTVQSVLYGMIRDFYRQIPVAFRCAIPLAQGVAHPVFLSSSAAFKEWDSSFVAYLRGRFAAEFDGADLLILGGADFKPKATLDGYFTESKDKGFQFEEAGWIKVGSVGAGYDNSVTRSPADPLRLRSIKEGVPYRQEWASLLAKKPQWILLDGWNDYANGASIAPTTEYGYTLSDITRISARFFAGTNRLALKFLGSDAPRALPSNTTLTVHARVQNMGVEGWAANGAFGAVPQAHLPTRKRRSHPQCSDKRLQQVPFARRRICA
jgi:hypothetical protein